MENIKSIILYDSLQRVCGFVELRTDKGRTIIRVSHTGEAKSKIIISIATPDASYAFSADSHESNFAVDKEIDLEAEVFVNLMHKVGNDLISLASGVINFSPRQVIESIKKQKESPPQPQPKSPPEALEAPLGKGIKEIDAILRGVCMMNDGEKGICNGCPYREHFYDFAIEEHSESG